MNLIIDIGNSSAKVALMENGTGRELFLETVPELETAFLKNVFERFPGQIRRAILSTTRHTNTQVEDYIKGVVEIFIHFNPAETPIPIENRYQTPETLGADRLAAAVGAWSMTDIKHEILIVDFGSAITIDRVSANGDFLGGNISPGMAMRFEALHRLTDKLPLISPEEVDQIPYTIIGKTTREAITGGVVLGIIGEIDGYIDRIYTENSHLTLFFTGRDANFFAGKVKKTIFVIRDLVIKGLNQILEYNTQHEDKQE